MKLKGEVTATSVAELINYLAEKIAVTEESTDEPMILGEKIGGGPSKKEKEMKDFVQSSEKVQKWVKQMEKQETSIEDTPVEKILADAKKKRTENEDNDEVVRFADWIETLALVRDQAVTT